MARTTTNPTFAEMEERGIRIADIKDLKSAKVGDFIGEAEKRKSSKLISIKGTISYERISFMNLAGKPLLSFYTDSEVNNYVWLDGLMMLMGRIRTGEQLSTETAKQIDSLVDIRRRTQLLALEYDGNEVHDKDGSVLPEPEQEQQQQQEQEQQGEEGKKVEEYEDEDELYDLDELLNVTRDFVYVSATS